MHSGSASCAPVFDLSHWKVIAFRKRQNHRCGHPLLTLTPRTNWVTTLAGLLTSRVVTRACLPRTCVPVARSAVARRLQLRGQPRIKAQSPAPRSLFTTVSETQRNQSPSGLSPRPLPVKNRWPFEPRFCYVLRKAATRAARRANISSSNVEAVCDPSAST